MSKSSRKEQQRKAYEAEMERRRNAIWNPPLDDEALAHFRQTCDRYFAAYEAVARPASVAVRPRHDAPPTKSHTGGQFLLPSNVEWPTTDDQPLAGVLEIHLDELPAVPKPLSEYDLLQVFLELESDDDLPRYAGGNWCVREARYSNEDELRHDGLRVEQSPIAWELVENDIPTYPDDLDLVDEDVREEFEALPNWSEMCADYFSSGLSTRVGGWPQWVSNGGNVGEFCLQLNEDVILVDLDSTVVFISEKTKNRETGSQSGKLGERFSAQIKQS